jgi:ribulose-phosphate 3-epimerase
VATLEDVLDIVDYVLVMSVNPGFGGQQFIPNALSKVRDLAARRKARGLQFPIEIDGGVNTQNLGKIIDAGVEWVVAGSSIFHSVNPPSAFEEMRRIAHDASAVRV